jgi:DNA-binding transcriptional MocR family regulator
MREGDNLGNGQITHWHAANRLREEIMSSLASGEKIDPEQVLADRYGVARNTMRKAIAQLRQEGILASRHGRGTFAAAVPSRQQVPLGPGDRARALLPEDGERGRRGLPPGVPLLVVMRAQGKTEYYDASRTDIMVPSTQGPAERATCGDPDENRAQ